METNRKCLLPSTYDYDANILKKLNDWIELKHTCDDEMELHYSKANKEPGNTFDERYTCCCQCHVKRRLPPAGPTHVHHPFINNTTSDVKSKHPIRSKLKSKFLTRFWRQTRETNNFSGSYRTRTEYRNRKKSLCWATSDENIATNLLCQKWWKSLFRKKQQIMRIMCRSVIFVIIVSVCGVLMYSDSHQQNDFSIDYYPTSDHHIDDYYSSGSSNVILDVPFKSVSVDEFEKHLDKSNNVADLLRIFFDQKDLSDFDINTIMNMKSKQFIYGTSHQKRENVNTARSWMNDDEDDIEDRAAAFEHHLEMAKSPLSTCRYPLPEVEYVRSVESDTFRHYYPRCTVVHRCRNYTGCCPDGTVCGPKKENAENEVSVKVRKRAKIRNRYNQAPHLTQDTNGKVTTSQTVFEVEPRTNRLRPLRRNFVEKRIFIDHTACECNRVDFATNCHKKCPQQFSKRRHDADCVCECTHHARLCKFIQRGHLPLEEKDLECIKAGECIEPKCASGKFRIHTGFCPKARKHHRRKG